MGERKRPFLPGYPPELFPSSWGTSIRRDEPELPGWRRIIVENPSAAT